MKAQKLMTKLTVRGAKLRAVGNTLLCEQIPKDLVSKIKEYKNELIDFIRYQQKKFSQIF